MPGVWLSDYVCCEFDSLFVDIVRELGRVADFENFFCVVHSGHDVVSGLASLPFESALDHPSEKIHVSRVEL